MFHRKLKFEPLEDRRLLAAYVVNNTGDVDDGLPNNGVTTLREVINLANALPGADSITFDAAMSGQTIFLGGTQIDITEELTIDATPLAQNVTIDANLGSRIFRIDDPNTSSESFPVTLAGLNLVHGQTTGPNPGGAIRSRTSGVLTLRESTVADSHTAAADGGGVWAANLLLERTTISGNSTQGAGTHGGGIWATTLVVDQSTISGNSTLADGGGAFVEETLTINLSTITGNTADRGGGIFRPNTASNYLIKIDGSILAANTAPTARDLRPAVTSIVEVNYSLIGTGVAPTAGGNNIVTNAPLLGLLADNGGPTQTHALLAGSPALDAGDPSAIGAPANDQRGAPFARIVDGDAMSGARIDIGAYELHRLVVDSAADVVDGNYGPGQFSLREATLLANALPGAHTITFATGMSGQTITLGGTELLLTDETTIDASPLAANVTIDANLLSRVFNITAASGNFTLAGLNLTRGWAGSNLYGGAIISQTSGLLTLIECSVSGSNGLFGGGIAAGALTLRQSTVSGNNSNNGGGGGIFAYSSVTLHQSTVSGNSSTNLGGGILAFNAVTLDQSTITNNQAEFGGGGVYQLDQSGNFPLTISGSILAGNTATVGSPDLHRDPGSAVTVNYSLIGTGVTPTAGGNNVVTNNPLLGPLANNGGPTQTHALLAGSPALNAGDPTAVAGAGNVPLNDQRGAPYFRVFGGRIDIGAYEHDVLVVNTTSDVVDGNYGPGQFSLREATLLANARPGADTILFAGGMSGQTITLTGGQLSITDSLTITGPGATLLTIDASGNDLTPATDNGNGSRVLNIDNGSSSTLIDVMLSGLTLTGGDVSGDGGAILTRENLTVASSVITGNAATGTGFGGGGGIYSYATGNPRNTLIVQDSTISGNRTSGEGGAIRQRFGALTVLRSTISGNTAQFAGGGISAANGGVDVDIRDSTINDNFSASTFFGGGGVFLYDSSPATISGSTISGNRTTLTGGGIDSNGSSTLTVRHSTITNNVANFDGIGGGAGGGFNASGTVALEHTIVAGNRRGAPGSQVADDIGGAVTARYSLIGDNTGATITNNGGNQIGTSGSPINPLLGPLADNGGPTQTHALLPGSPALDTGDPAAVVGLGSVPLYDQRGIGFVRIADGNAVAGARIDIGAYESQGIPGWPVGDYDHNGIADAADYVVWRKNPAAHGGDPAGYNTWRSNFGNTVVPVSAAAAAVGSTEEVGLVQGAVSSQLAAISLAESTTVEEVAMTSDELMEAFSSPPSAFSLTSPTTTHTSSTARRSHLAVGDPTHANAAPAHDAALLLLYDNNEVRRPGPSWSEDPATPDAEATTSFSHEPELFDLWSLGPSFPFDWE